MKGTKKPEAIIYCHSANVTTQTRSILLERQEMVCREYAGHKSYDVVAVFTDAGVSGLQSDNRSMVAMLEFLRERNSEEPCKVIIDDVSRLSRDMVVHLQIRNEIYEAGGRLESPSFDFTDTPEARLAESLLMSAVQHRREKVQQAGSEELECS